MTIRPPSATYDYDSRGFWRVRLPFPGRPLTLLFGPDPVHGFAHSKPVMELIVRRQCDRCRAETPHRQRTEARSCRRVECLECGRETYRSPAGVEVLHEGKAPENHTAPAATESP